MGNVGISHVRYPTSGDGLVNECQPFYVNYPCGSHLRSVPSFLVGTDARVVPRVSLVSFFSLQKTLEFWRRFGVRGLPRVSKSRTSRTRRLSSAPAARTLVSKARFVSLGGHGRAPGRAPRMLPLLLLLPPLLLHGKREREREREREVSPKLYQNTYLCRLAHNGTLTNTKQLTRSLVKMRIRRARVLHRPPFSLAVVCVPLSLSLSLSRALRPFEWGRKHRALFSSPLREFRRHREKFR